MPTERPDPEQLLKQLEKSDAEHRSGRLKIFFGYAAGVGKTYAMLQAAHAAQRAGIDVAVGYIEPHTRPDTLALLQGLECLPALEIQHKGIVLHEFDLDGALRRHPQLLLVDELAHTNAAGCRHVKRYQDIAELLGAGVDVYTTVNVQHIESLNDIVASITGVLVRERIPDRVFDDADQVELVDIEPEDLIQRLEQGKVYQAQQAQTALRHFFHLDNLVSLREIALRRTADRVNRLLEKSKQASSKADYYTEENILICLSPSPSNAKVIRTAARMANAFKGTFTALFVETSRFAEMSQPDKLRLRANLKLAEQLGANIATAYGDDVPMQIAEYARLSGVSKIVIGRTNTRRRFPFAKTAFIDRLTELAPNVDIYVIPDKTVPPYHAVRPKGSGRRNVFSAADTAKSAGILVLATLIGLIFSHVGFSEANIITVYILGVLVTAVVTSHRVYSLVSSLLSVLVFNYFFTYPQYTLAAYDKGYPITFVVMFLAAFLTGTLTTRIKSQARQAAQRAYRTRILLETSQKLQRAGDSAGILQETASQLIKLLDKTVVFYRKERDGLSEPTLYPRQADAAEDAAQYSEAGERAVAEWVLKNNKHAGATTDTLPGARCLYLAVRSGSTVYAVVGIALHDEQLDAFANSLLMSMLDECALALEKEQLNETKKKVAMQAQQEQLRANLLRSISHDLRTPLTGISGNAGVLLSNADCLDEAKKQQLYTDIYDDSLWLINLVENLLSVTRIEDGTMQIHMEGELLEEVVHEALRHVNRRSVEHTIRLELEDDLLMAHMDARLMIQVFINIVDNAIKYTQPGSTIVISGRRQGKDVCVEIADDGNGIPDEEKAHLFDMFYTASSAVADSRRGLGLGLALCKSIVTAHGGSISVRDNLPHGAVFRFTLQAEEVRLHDEAVDPGRGG